MERETTRATLVEDVRPGATDFACNKILCVYQYNPPYYAVYRTADRVMIHYADDPEIAKVQRKQISGMAPLRGQIGSLIDGWHSAREWLWSRRDAGDNPLRKRATRYDRRVADALIVALEGGVADARDLLREIKNDIISERTSMARAHYLIVALALAAGLTIVTALLGLSASRRTLGYPDEMLAVWTAVSGGTLGAFFSIAIGLKGRTVLIDLQNRDNVADAFLRMLIGAIAGGMLLCLLVSGLISDVIKTEELNPGNDDKYRHLLVFVVGFLAGFFERLVPDLLSQTNLGTKEGGSAKDVEPGGAGTPAPVQPTPDPGALAAPEGGPKGGAG